MVRTSPLHDRCTGFLLGHALALACGQGRRARDDERAWLTGFLRDLQFDPAILDVASGGATGSGRAMLDALRPALASRSRELADFALLGALLARMAVAGGAPLADIERLRDAYRLPPLDRRRFAPADRRAPNPVRVPSLAYLREIVGQLPAEEDTALVLAPMAAPFREYVDAFCRPTLEQCGYRALRLWAGMSGPDGAELLLALIPRCGLVWADLSAPGADIAYGVGAAHALGKVVVAVACEDAAPPAPLTIGHDAVVRYDPHDPDWPTGSVLLMAACLAATKLAADRGDRLRVTPGPIAAVFDQVSHALGRILLPPDAREAQRRGRRALDAGDLALAEASFDEACRLGLHDDETHLWRGWARVGLGRADDATRDFDAVLGSDPLAPPVGEWRPIAAYLRAALREAGGNVVGALQDIELALALGLDDAEVRERRDALAARTRRAGAS